MVMLVQVKILLLTFIFATVWNWYTVSMLNVHQFFWKFWKSVLTANKCQQYFYLLMIISWWWSLTIGQQAMVSFITFSFIGSRRILSRNLYMSLPLLYENNSWIGIFKKYWIWKFCLQLNISWTAASSLILLRKEKCLLKGRSLKQSSRKLFAKSQKGQQKMKDWRKSGNFSTTPASIREVLKNIDGKNVSFWPTSQQKKYYAPKKNRIGPRLIFLNFILLLMPNK